MLCLFHTYRPQLWERVYDLLWRPVWPITSTPDPSDASRTIDSFRIAFTEFHSWGLDQHVAWSSDTFQRRRAFESVPQTDNIKRSPGNSTMLRFERCCMTGNKRSNYSATHSQRRIHFNSSFMGISCLFPLINRASLLNNRDEGLVVGFNS